MKRARTDAKHLQNDIAVKLRTDPRLADVTFVVQGQAIRAASSVLRAASSVLFDLLCREDVSGTQVCPLPPLVTADGFNAVLDFVMAPAENRGVLARRTASVQLSEDTFCSAAVEAMVAADYLKIPGMVDTVSATIMARCKEGRLHVVAAWGMLQAVGSQEDFKKVMDSLFGVMVDAPKTWLLGREPGGQPFTARLSSAQLAELIGTARAQNGLPPELEFRAVLQWVNHRMESEDHEEHPSRQHYVDACLAALFDAEHLSHGMSASFLKETVLPSKLVAPSVIFDALMKMALKAEALGIDFRSHANVLSDSRDPYITWDVQLQNNGTPSAPKWDFHDRKSEPFYLEGGKWWLTARKVTRGAMTSLGMWLHGDPVATIKPGQVKYRATFEFVVRQQQSQVGTTPRKDVTMQLVTSFTATTLWKGRGFANLMAMDGLVDPANGFVSSTGAVRFQLRTRTNRNRSGLDGVQHVEPFADLYNHLWAPDRGVQVETSAR